jgi:hypothetical protein
MENKNFVIPLEQYVEALQRIVELEKNNIQIIKELEEKIVGLENDKYILEKKLEAQTVELKKHSSYWISNRKKFISELKNGDKKTFVLDRLLKTGEMEIDLPSDNETMEDAINLIEKLEL